MDEGGGMAWNPERLWERQDGESGKAYEAFAAYRDMGAARTVSAVARQLRKSRALIDRWKRRWNWPERVRAYDRELERAAHEEAVKAVREMSRRHIGLAVRMQSKALEALPKLNANKMRVKDVVALIHEAVKLERDSRAQIVEDTAPQDEDEDSFSFSDIEDDGL